MNSSSEKLQRLYAAMTDYFKGDPAQIRHFAMVHSFSAWIGREEGLDEERQCILEAAALTHDAGIRPAMEKYGRCDGKLQEQEGPAPVRAMLSCLGFSEAMQERVAYLVGHHHSYGKIDGPDYQILVEADFLVNLYSEKSDRETIRRTEERIFRTGAGRRLLRRLYDLEE